MVIDGISIYQEEFTITDCSIIKFPKIFKKDFSYGISRGKDSYKVLPLFCGFDIETTNIVETKSAYMYIASLCIATKRQCFIYHFRKWDYFKFFLDELSNHYKLNAKQRIVVYDANFGFEFQFLSKRLEWLQDDFSFFAKEQRKPLLATTNNYIEFREALSITGGSLDYLSQNYTTTKKAVGDLDYNVLRNSTTPLNKTEMKYINNDVVILSEFAYYIFENFLKVNHKFPLTQTGILRQDLKKRTKQSVVDFDAYRNYIKNLFPSYNDYCLYFEYLFRGGYVHANIRYVNDELNDILSFDETSAYPSVMLLENNYPVSPFKETECNYTWLYYCLENYACIMDLTFTNLYQTTSHSIESDSKCLDLQGANIDNGRIKSADSVRVLLTEQDFFNYEDFYSWDSFTIHSLKIAKRGSLPIPLLEQLKDDYKYKDYLKQNGFKHTTNYALYKSRVNSYYGMTVTRISLDNWKFNGEWINDNKSFVDYENEISKNILSPFWGFWITANARRNLLKVCKLLESALYNSVIYNDTDSIKCLDSPIIHEIIKQYNDELSLRKQEIGLTEKEFSTLGEFELECKYKRFKTLGAKRYLVEYENGNIEATIAGFPKSALQNINDPFEQFTLNPKSRVVMELQPVESKKKTAYYNDEQTEAIINGERMIEYSSVCIYAIPFTLKLGELFYANLLDKFTNERKNVL